MPLLVESDLAKKDGPTSAFLGVVGVLGRNDGAENVGVGTEVGNNGLDPAVVLLPGSSSSSDSRMNPPTPQPPRTSSPSIRTIRNAAGFALGGRGPPGMPGGGGGKGGGACPPGGKGG
ncbi:hypothetical protein GCM10010411_58460 [Actinomadura fulvescens]|uniref:Uncharacterized protein n=1 Tax=Actinomadura fulvescens TaxID=46160 RepID=A0ABP6CH32_9ACTN